MTLVPYENINECKYRTDNYRILSEFAKSDLDCAEIKDFTQKKASYCATSLQRSIKIYKMASIECVFRKGKVLLIKKKMKKESSTRRLDFIERTSYDGRYLQGSLF